MKLIFALVIFMYTHSSWALTAQEEKHYIYTRQMCAGDTPSKEFLEKSSVWFQAYSESGIFDSLQNPRSTFRISRYLEELTSSMGFYKALNECFGSDQLGKDLFFISLLGLDISGKMTSWALDLSLMKALYWGIKTFLSGGYKISMRMAWMWARVAMIQSLKNDRRVFFYAVPFGMVGHLAYKLSAILNETMESRLNRGYSQDEYERLKREKSILEEQIHKGQGGKDLALDLNVINKKITLIEVMMKQERASN